MQLDRARSSSYATEPLTLVAPLNRVLQAVHALQPLPVRGSRLGRIEFTPSNFVPHMVLARLLPVAGSRIKLLLAAAVRA